MPFIYIHIVIQLSSVLFLSCYLVIFGLQFIFLLFCAHCLYARAVLFTHTLTRSLSDDPGFTRPDIGRFVSIARCSMRPYILRGVLGLSLWFWYSHLSYLSVIFWFYLYRIQLPFSFLYSSVIIVLDIYMSYCSDNYLSW